MTKLTIFFAACCFFFSLQLSAQEMAHVGPVSNADNSEMTTNPSLADRFAPTFADDFLPVVDYPELAREYAVEGMVVVEVEVAASGQVTPIRIARPLFKACDDAAWNAAAQLPRMLPAVKNGRPVAKRVMVPFRFSLR